MSTRPVFIAGGAGWIGGLLRTAWSAQDLRVVDLRGGAGIVQGDLRRPGGWTNLLAGVDTAVHVAGVGRSDASREEVWAPNVTTTETLLEACAAHDVRRVVLASSVWALAGSDARTVPGDAPADPGDNAYGASKAAAEAALAQWAAQDPTRIGIVLRLGGCVPGGDSPRPAQVAWEDACWLGRDDCVSAFSAAAGANSPGCHLVTVVSLCDSARWSVDAARRVLGYQPAQRLVISSPSRHRSRRWRR